MNKNEKTLNEQIEEHYQNFRKHIILERSCSIKSDNSLICAGKLKEPEDHIIPKINEFLFEVHTANKEGNNIETKCSFKLTKAEMLETTTCIVKTLQSVEREKQNNSVRKYLDNFKK